MDELKSGDRIKMTQAALDNWLHDGGNRWPNSSAGVFIKYNSNMSILVLRDGRKNPTSYHIDFWVKE